MKTGENWGQTPIFLIEGKNWCENWGQTPIFLIDSFEDIGISSGIIDRRYKYKYNKIEFERQFNRWKNEYHN